VTSVTDSIELRVSLQGRRWRVDTTRTHDLSIPLAFDAPQPNFFGAPQASASALTAGSFVGDVREGGSCNCATYSFTPHCNGTHTECVGHLTRERVGIRDISTPAYAIARVVTLAPVPAATAQERSDPAPRAGDELITRAALEAALGTDALSDASALIVRTTPNPASKQHRSYGPERAPPYFTADFMRWIVAQGVQHLIVDLPSIDRAEDEGRLTAHRIFFGLPPGSADAAQATRADATVTELAYISDSIPDGWYLLNLQIAPFAADAAPSRPLLMPLLPP
jgi:kynurenine formamidase